MGLLMRRGVRQRGSESNSLQAPDAWLGCWQITFTFRCNALPLLLLSVLTLGRGHARDGCAEAEAEADGRAGRGCRACRVVGE